jgi:hypothetical protein
MTPHIPCKVRRAKAPGEGQTMVTAYIPLRGVLQSSRKGHEWMVIAAMYIQCLKRTGVPAMQRSENDAVFKKSENPRNARPREASTPPCMIR